MKIAYVRSVFPKMSETFILEELLYLKRIGHQLRIYATNWEADDINKKMFDGALFDNVEYHIPPFAVTRLNLLAIFQFLKNLLIQPRARTRLLAILFAEKNIAGLMMEAWRCEKPVRTGMLASVVCILRFAGKVGWKCVRLGNLSLALHQVILKHAPLDPDIIHAPFLFENDVAWLASLLHRKPSLPFTVSLRSRDLYSNNVPAKLTQVRQMLIRDAAEIFTISAYNQRVIAQALPLRASPKVVYSSIDTSYFTRDPTRERSAGALLCVARLVEKKGLAVLLDACAELARRGRHFHLTVIGEGPMLGALLSRRAQLGLDESITFAGRVGTEGVRSRMEVAQAFILPCVVASDGDRDILPNSLKEAMSMEVPIVTSRVSGIEELVSHGITGILVKPNDPIALADGIEKILSSPRGSRLYGVLGRRFVTGHFDINKQGAILAERLESIVAQHSDVKSV